MNIAGQGLKPEEEEGAKGGKKGKLEAGSL